MGGRIAQAPHPLGIARRAGVTQTDLGLHRVLGLWLCQQISAGVEITLVDAEQGQQGGKHVAVAGRCRLL